MMEFQNEQELFDYIVSRIIAQGRAAMEGNQCVYHSPDKSLKCAAGHTITDDEYTLLISEFGYVQVEGCPLDDFKGALPFNHALRIYNSLVEELQSAHDNSANSMAFMEYFLAEAKEIAVSRKLSFNFDKELEKGDR